MKAPRNTSPPLRFSNTTSTAADVVPVGRKHVDCTPATVVSQSTSTFELKSMSGSSTVMIAGMHEAFVSVFGLQSANVRNWSSPITANAKFSCVAPAARVS